MTDARDVEKLIYYLLKSINCFQFLPVSFQSIRLLQQQLYNKPCYDDSCLLRQLNITITGGVLTVARDVGIFSFPFNYLILLSIEARGTSCESYEWRQKW